VVVVVVDGTQVTPVALAVAAPVASFPAHTPLAVALAREDKVVLVALEETLKATLSATAAVVVEQVVLDKTLLLTSVALVLAAPVPPTQSVQALHKPMQAVVAVVR
jgi:hypothetical protein